MTSNGKKFAQYRLKLDDEVLIYTAKTKKALGIGKYIGFDDISFLNKKLITPKFRLISNPKKIIRGYDCWWIPKTIADKLEKTIVSLT